MPAWSQAQLYEEPEDPPPDDPPIDISGTLALVIQDMNDQASAIDDVLALLVPETLYPTARSKLTAARDGLNQAAATLSEGTIGETITAIEQAETDITAAAGLLSVLQSLIDQLNLINQSLDEDIQTLQSLIL
jgi:hypothetical protein